MRGSAWKAYREHPAHVTYMAWCEVLVPVWNVERKSPMHMSSRKGQLLEDRGRDFLDGYWIVAAVTQLACWLAE